MSDKLVWSCNLYLLITMWLHSRPNQSETGYPHFSFLFIKVLLKGQSLQQVSMSQQVITKQYLLFTSQYTLWVIPRSFISTSKDLSSTWMTIPFPCRGPVSCTSIQYVLVLFLMIKFANGNDSIIVDIKYCYALHGHDIHVHFQAVQTMADT